ncbi:MULTISPECIES: glycosyltransferase family 4 protein [Haloarcula]|uniref:glycosyltransferase family 4 protein n=1 Tax=Haloarcula TaxID=2237 RepID=UPI0023ED8713|nr:glycosyltransferase family 4 protein [Halomicroarcula sp. XH51]
MDVAFVTSAYPPRSPGGAGTSSKLIVEGLRDAGVHVDIFALTEDGADPVRMQDNRYHLPDGTHYGVPIAIGENLSAYFHLPDLHEYDVIHVYNVRHLPACVLRADPPVVATYNNHMWTCIDPVAHLSDGVPECSLRHRIRYAKTKGYTGVTCLPRVAFNMLGKSIAQQADLLTVQTEGMKSVLSKSGYESDNIRKVPNILDDRFIVEPENEKEILFVGRLKPSKGPKTVLEAFQSLSQQYEDWSLRLYGKGELEGEIRDLIEGDSQVSLEYCPYDSLPSVYKNASVLVHASRYTEPFSRSWLEAMGSKTSIVCSENPSSVDILGDIAVLYDPFSSSDLARTLERVLSRPALRTEMAHAGYDAVTKYRPEKIVDGYISAYDECR